MTITTTTPRPRSEWMKCPTRVTLPKTYAGMGLYLLRKLEERMALAEAEGDIELAEDLFYVVDSFDWSVAIATEDGDEFRLMNILPSLIYHLRNAGATCILPDANHRYISPDYL